MKVKIGDTIYDSARVPIMVILSAHERDLLIDQPEKSSYRFCSHPNGMPKEDVSKFMGKS